MKKPERCLSVWVLLAVLGTGQSVFAAEGDEDEKKKKGPEQSGHTETVVVTASRTAQPLNNVAAAVTVVTGEQLENSPVDNYGDVLRTVPGVNVAQMSARDIQVTSRGATNSLATSQLVLLDNRSLYLDFFGFVMWDFAPMDPNHIKQVEVVRGPGSAVWGANAMTGVINILTKSPKETPGTTITLGGGELGTLNGAVSHSGSKGDFSYRLDASYYEQDPYDRPTGIIPGTMTPYPSYTNQGTQQPKVNLRFDWDTEYDSTFSVRGGWAATDGIIHTGIGPFDIDKGTSLSFVSAEWEHKAQRASFFVNALDGEAPNLLTVDATTGMPIFFTFKSETYNLDYTNTSIVGGKHALTYGGNARHNQFDLSIAPQGDTRDEYGAFLQAEMLFGKVRWLVGARVDDLDPIGTVVSPRTSVLVKVADKHALRFSYNRAFRSPSMVQNYLDATIFTPQLVPAMSGLAPFALGFNSVASGNVDLVEEQLDAYEVGWVGQVGNTTMTLSLYRNETADSVDFYTSGVYPVDPTGLPSQPALLTDVTDASGMFVLCTAGTELRNCDPDGPGPSPDLYAITRSMLPFTFSYRNIGEIVDRGAEFSVNTTINDQWSYFFNYSWQDEPDVTGIPQGEINLAPTNRANLGFAYNAKRWFINGNVNYQDEAFWTDVLDSRFWGPTDSFTAVNASAGVRFGELATVSLSAYNLTDEDMQQHVFGDIIGRRVVGQVMFHF